MMPIVNNHDIACFFVTKHHIWKGKYKRIFSIGSKGVTTYNPTSLEVTNRWSYNDFVSIQPLKGTPNEFQISVKKEKKILKMTFSTEHRSHLITEALRFRQNFMEKPKDVYRYQAYKHHWSDIRLPVLLEVTPYSLDQLDPTTSSVLASYHFKDFEGICTISDYPGGFVIVCGGFGRLHLFQAADFEQIKIKIMEFAASFLAVNIKVLGQPINLEDFQRQRFGKYSDDNYLTSVSEFSVYKIQKPRHSEPVRRILCLSEVCLLERDPQTYSICTLQPLCDIFALIRDNKNPQLFSVAYVNGQIRTYTTTDRDALLASLLDGVRASGNKDIHVTMIQTQRGLRLGPLHLPVEEEAESLHLKFLQNPPVTENFFRCVQRFNANAPYSGLLYSVSQEGIFSENKEKLIMAALQSLVAKEGDQKTISAEELEAQFQALRRLLASKVGYASFTKLAGFREAIGMKVVTALKRNDFAVTHAAVDMIGALMHPMHDDYDLRQEQLNKSSLLQTKSFLESLLGMWATHIVQGTGALIVTAMLDFLTFALCVPYSETTDGKHFDNLLEMVADRGRILFKLFQHPSMAVVKGAGLVMRALIEEGDSEVAAKMQNLALAEGALPRHLLAALYTQGSDGRMLTHRQLSRHLIGLWISGNPIAMGLLKRIMPVGLIAFLDSRDALPDSAKEREMLNHRDNLKIAQDHASRMKKNPNWAAMERQLKNVEKQVEHYTNLALQHWGARVGINLKREEKTKERPVVLRRRRERIKAESNWPLFYWNFSQDHALPNLIWNHKTREELRCALENEIRMFANDRDLAGNALVAWNHQEFELDYQCLADEVKIGDYYLRLLLEMDENNDDSPIRRSYEFFNDLYHRFLLTNKVEMKCMCLQAMSIVYGRYYEDIGPFSDTKYIVVMLERCTDKMERDRLITFINKLILHRRNVRDLMDMGGVKILVDLVTLAHLHTSRAMVPTQTNVIEAGPGMSVEQKREWHYNTEEGSKGPVTFDEVKELFQKGVINHKTRCWAMGLDGWRAFSQLPQLKWCLLAKGTPVLNESELATYILNTLIRICEYFPSRDSDDAVIRPLPKIKRLLSEQTTLSHVVQLLLTFDPILVEKVATLLHDVMKDNPEMPKVYLTGVFYFILMYTGSNVLPIAKFLKLTHIKQAFKADENTTSDIMQKSILGKLLPEAMVNYLENHGAEKFAQIFLGEFDTPEAIWNAQMRRLLIEKIAAHIADFTPRLRSHNMARYLYIAIPTVRYPQLERELFCNIFYLRHLCDTIKFPDWPIPDPIGLLKDVLDAWRTEVEKKPPLMTIEEAYAKLGLDGINHDEAKIRKSYYKLAQQYHPDKNPDGRERFEEVNQAYEFLCSRIIWNTDGPNPNNIVLILRTQSILFCRYSEVLHPYKYAGYPQLIKTIGIETADEQLFSKTDPLLSAATELAYRTVQCSSLNAEELRRENGLETLLEAYSRCVNVLSNSSKPNDTAVQVCLNITQCFSVAAQFQACRECMINLTQLVKDLCRILYFKHLTKLCSAATECVQALAVDPILQLELLKAGALWHLLLFVFKYDYTLDEGGVEKSEDSNEQELSNRLAKESVKACAALARFKGDPQTGTRENLIMGILEGLITPYVARQLMSDQPEEVLKTLNSNSETPYLIWDNGTRAELVDFLESQLAVRDDFDLNIGSDFKYSAHKEELKIGGIFIRIYNEQPMFQIKEPKNLVVDILAYLNDQSSYLFNLVNIAYSVTIEKRLEHSTMALAALTNVVRNNTGVEMQCIGHFRLVFSLLNVSHAPIAFGALNLIGVVARNNECINDIAASGVLGHLLLVLFLMPEAQEQVLDILRALMTNTKIVKESLNKGAVIYMLDLFCNSNDVRVRQSSAELLAKMSLDKLVGPKVRLAIETFLPPIFSDAMRDSPETSVTMFESEHEHPELIWNQDAKDRVCSIVATLKSEHYQAQSANRSAMWKKPDTNGLANVAMPNEVIVGGVYLRIFVANPAWTLRRPKEFLCELLDACLNHMSKDKVDVELLDLTTNALCSLLQAQPALLDLIPSMGHIPRLCKQLGSSAKDGVVPKSAILIFNSLTISNVCIHSISQTDCMFPLKRAMQIRADMVAVACEALNRMFSSNQEPLVKQALDADFVQFLLGLLEGRLELLDNPSATKAQIVKALKSMGRSLLYGDRINAILERSGVWAEYKDQKHDLFISNTNISGYLTAGTPSTAGYLTQGPSSKVHMAPPPVDKDDQHRPIPDGF
ncbi:dnaJ homolog subfamily C member 13 [Cylas formicarius]|uniref:dnaJ homolog subfamily C member 13 n=1 Tax=Cylas formicarius TaxID=197179 RepID=UPI0029588A11|nr:dnaJ homolog subfamily C member 13 [Cylas formicarius]